MISREVYEAWDAYVIAENNRVRAEMKTRLRDFVSSLLELPVDAQHDWALSFAKSVVDDGCRTPVRFPLFREVLFPALKAGIQDRQQGCARWLAHFDVLLAQSPECQSQLPEQLQSSYGLLHEALDVDPEDAASRKRLANLLRAWLEYSIHEVPHGVLYEANGASIEQCVKLKSELAEFQELVSQTGFEKGDVELIRDCRFHFQAYADYLASGSDFRSYRSYLSSLDLK
ncbi:hypothetical protein [Aeoliella sp. SH292]|uniref:hypothetical protein n=1 Tax=Aeoliella sp. SH292 TaxID=3454464 RepID=UPI003F9D6CB7